MYPTMELYVTPFALKKRVLTQHLIYSLGTRYPRRCRHNYSRTSLLHQRNPPCLERTRRHAVRSSGPHSASDHANTIAFTSLNLDRKIRINVLNTYKLSDRPILK